MILATIITLSVLAVCACVMIGLVALDMANGGLVAADLDDEWDTQDVDWDTL